MVKLKKEYYNFKDLRALESQGLLTIERNKSLDTHGTSSSGLVVRIGITVTSGNNKKNYQIKFNSKGYGAVTDKIVWFNGRTLKHYGQYFDMVNIWLEGNGLEV